MGIYKRRGNTSSPNNY